MTSPDFLNGGNMVLIGARWDDEMQNRRLKNAKDNGLIKFIEINYPIANQENPYEIEIPFFAHSANNPLCSAFGLDFNLLEMIKKEADRYDSPWIGEHLSWSSFQNGNALGYVLNPIYNEDFFKIAIDNITTIQKHYNRPVALELGPQYDVKGDFADEVDFLVSVARATKSHVILDLTHLLISNHNLGRGLDYGFDRFLSADTVEIHIAGIRESYNQEFWHDCHDVLPSQKTLDLLREFLAHTKTVKAITFEHSAAATESDFYSGLESLHKTLANV